MTPYGSGNLSQPIPMAINGRDFHPSHLKARHVLAFEMSIEATCNWYLTLIQDVLALASASPPRSKIFIV